MAELVIRSAELADYDALAEFMTSQSGTSVDPVRLAHWYRNTPSGSASVIIGLQGDRIIGMATTNDLRFAGPQGDALVAMPQKVLVDASMRGRGIFAKLYWASEEACRSRGVDFFLTVTNAASTPIFLGKFGYMRLPSPIAIIAAPAFGKVICGDRPHLISEQKADLGDAWHVKKDDVYFNWRFHAHPDPTHVQQSVHHEGRYIGELYLKRTKKKGLPVILVLDAVPASSTDLPQLLRAARILAADHRCIGTLALERPGMWGALGGVPRKRMSSGFNLLTKGRDAAHTEQLVGAQFTLAFGDLDFL